MGEPLDNYKCVVEAIRCMSSPNLFGIAPRHICVSTVGIISKMNRFADDLPGVNLALSLHAPTQQLRERIVPTAKAYPLPKLLQAIDTHLSRNKKTRVLIECIVIKVRLNHCIRRL